MSLNLQQLPQMRFDLVEAARILRLSRAALYQRIQAGQLRIQKDGRRSFVTAAELQRYVASCNVVAPVATVCSWVPIRETSLFLILARRTGRNSRRRRSS